MAALLRSWPVAAADTDVLIGAPGHVDGING
jgi:hypothetical protein